MYFPFLTCTVRFIFLDLFHLYKIGMQNIWPLVAKCSGLCPLLVINKPNGRCQVNVRCWSAAIVTNGVIFLSPVLNTALVWNNTEEWEYAWPVEGQLAYTRLSFKLYFFISMTLCRNLLWTLIDSWNERVLPGVLWHLVTCRISSNFWWSRYTWAVFVIASMSWNYHWIHSVLPTSQFLFELFHSHKSFVFRS